MARAAANQSQMKRLWSAQLLFDVLCRAVLARPAVTWASLG